MAIPGFWKAESEMQSAKRHVTAARHEYRSHDRRMSEFELGISECKSRDLRVTRKRARRSSN